MAVYSFGKRSVFGYISLIMSKKLDFEFVLFGPLRSLKLIN